MIHVSRFPMPEYAPATHIFSNISAHEGPASYEIGLSVIWKHCSIHNQLIFYSDA